MPKVSIVVPVYNVDKYLKQCLNSILNQSYVDWECIVIDDGSTDLSWKICDNFARKDHRFRVIHQKNQGVSKARNVGIESAKGEFLVFVDPDDYINDDYLTALINEQKRSDADVVQAYIDLNTDNYKASHTIIQNSFIFVKSLSNRKISLKTKSSIIDTIAILRPSSWGYLFKYEIWKTLRFPEGINNGEDLFSVLEVLCNAESIESTDYAIYYYRIHNKGLSHRKISTNEFEDILRSWQKSCYHLIEEYKCSRWAINSLYASHIFHFRQRHTGVNPMNGLSLFLPQNLE